MLQLGPIAFAAPLYLTALVVLPVIWWLLRTTPPTPRRIRFPAIRLLFGLRETEETPARTPLWLLILRIVLATLIILALSRPVLNPEREFDSNGPLLLLVDNGWAAAAHWQDRRDAMEDLISRAGRDGRAVAILTTAGTAGAVLPPPRLQSAGDALEQARAIEPQPWPVDREAALQAIDDSELAGSINVVWLSDGLDGPATEALATRLQRLGGLRILVDSPENLPLVLAPPAAEGARLMTTVSRAEASGERPFWLRATDQQGNVVTRREGQFGTAETSVDIELPLPVERRNQIGRLAVENEASAGAVVLLDDRWQRRPVGLVSGRALETAQPLLSDLYYLERALEPFSEVRRGEIADLLDGGLAVLVLADVGTLTTPEIQTLESWIADGGVLVRFSGPRMSQGTDDLVPVRLRRGERALGGAMSWSQPAQLARFGEVSPFAGLAIPDEVEIQSQILAEPAVDLIDKTWARLTDGTPLVTADRRGQGWLVLVHTTANTDWSNLPLSGLFVDMMRRMADLGQGVADRTTVEAMAPLETLDGFGRLRSASASVSAIPGPEWLAARVTPSTPPGYYGFGGLRRSLNLTPEIGVLRPIGRLPQGVDRVGYGVTQETDILPWLLTAALLLLLADLMISLLLRGLVAARAGVAASALALAVAVVPPPVSAQEFDDPFSSESTAKRGSLDIHLAYVMTGIPQVDDDSRDGLRGLNAVLTRRTSVEPAIPIALDIESDDLSVYPILYWPVVPGQAPPSDQAVAKLNTYLRHGGMILFDTRERNPSVTDSREAVRMLRQLLSGLDIPPLVPVPEEHVLTRSFYLMSHFPGRWRGGTLWVEEERRVNDGVSSIVVGGHDWAGAWAIDDGGRPKYAVVPDGERQRELAYRFGVNLIMYALTGNYKADQVHIPAIMERLGL